MANTPLTSGLALPAPSSGTMTLPAYGRPSTGFAPAPVAAHYVPVQAAPPPQEVAVTVISLADLLRYVRRRWKLGLAVALPMAALTFAWLGLGEKVYEAEARLLLRIQDANVFNFSEMSHSGSSEVSAPMLVNNHRAELQARRYMEYLYTRIPAADRDAYIAPEMAPKSKGFFGSLTSGSAPAQPLSPKETFIKKLSENIRVEPLKDSHIIRVMLRGHDPNLAARLVNAYVQEYISYVAQQDLSVNKAASDFLEKKGEELRKRLQESEHDLSSYRQSESLMDTTDSKDLSGEKTRLLTEALAAAEVRLTTTRQNLENVRQAQAAGRDLLQIKLIGDNPDVGAGRKLLEAAEADLSNMRVLLGAKHPKVQEMTRKIETLKSQLQQAVNSIVSMISGDEANNIREVDDLHRQLDAAKHDLLAQGGKNVQQNLLRDRVAIDRELYQKIVLRMNQAHLTGDFTDNGELRMADSAVPPDRPVKPSKPIALLASLMVFGLAFGGLPVGLGLAGDYLMPLWRDQGAAASAVRADTALQDASGGGAALADSDAGSALSLATSHLPVLAHIPDVPLATPPELLAAILSDAAGINGTIGNLCGSLVAHQPRSGPHVLLLLSAERAEGKTLLASTIAGFLTMSGQRVLLMDCNPDAPAVHRWFRLASTHSSGASDLNALRYSNSSLFVLPGHDLPSYDFHELVSGYTAWIGRAQNQVDWIIVDGPSVLRNYADALALLSLATDIVMVHDPGRTTYEKVKAALNLLHPRVDPGLFRGMVLNRQKG